MKLIDHYIRVNPDSFGAEQVLTIAIPLTLVDPNQTKQEADAKIIEAFYSLYDQVRGMAQKIKGE